MLEWGLRSGNYRKGQKPKSNERLKRDVREVTKYVETALVLDKAMVSFIILGSPFFFLSSFLSHEIEPDIRFTPNLFAAIYTVYLCKTYAALCLLSIARLQPEN